jgi:hypothetical protein
MAAIFQNPALMQVLFQPEVMRILMAIQQATGQPGAAGAPPAAGMPAGAGEGGEDYGAWAESMGSDPMMQGEYSGASYVFFQLC